MTTQHLELPGSERAALRAIVVIIDEQIASLAKHPASDAHRAEVGNLAESWAEIVKLLALGQAAPLRECPQCKHLGMRAAIRCGFCWAKLVPLPHSENDQDVQAGPDQAP